MDKSYNQQYIQEDEIDLRELWNIIISKKKFIILFTLIITLGSAFYAYSKHPTPIYSGNMMIEIGVAKSSNSNQAYFDNAKALKNIIEKLYSVNVKTNANNILTIKTKGVNKESIKNNLMTIFNYTVARHKSKTKLYDKYIMTKQIGNISISNKPINTPKRKLIIFIAFITSLILSIFIVFFIDFIKNDKE